MKFQSILYTLLSVLLSVQSKPIVEHSRENERQKRQGFSDLFGYNGNLNSQSGSNSGFGNYGTNGISSNFGNQANSFAPANQQVNPQNSQTNTFGTNYFGSNQQNSQSGSFQNSQGFNGQNNGFQNLNNNQFSGIQNNGFQNQNNQFGNFQSSQGYNGQNFLGQNSQQQQPIIDPVIMLATTKTNIGTTTTNDSHKPSEIPVFTIEPPKENYSKSFDPYFGMTTRKIPKTPQAYWFSRYYGFTAPIAAIPFSNYNRI